ncbi:MAG: acyl carrier protein [Rikenellaceae bacterium]
MGNIETRVISLIAEHLGVEISKITLASDLIEDLGADELDMVELAMAFEEEFEVEITDDIVEKLFTVEGVVGYLKERGC